MANETPLVRTFRIAVRRILRRLPHFGRHQVLAEVYVSFKRLGSRPTHEAHFAKVSGPVALTKIALHAEACHVLAGKQSAVPSGRRLPRGR